MWGSGNGLWLANVVLLTNVTAVHPRMYYINLPGKGCRFFTFNSNTAKKKNALAGLEASLTIVRLAKVTFMRDAKVQY